MWYATQTPRQQFVLEEAIAYDEPLAGLGALGRAVRSAQARKWTKAMTGQTKKVTRFTPGAQIANTGYVVQPAAYDPTVTRYTSPIEQTRAAHRRAVGNTLAAQRARQAAALQAKYEQENPWLFRDPTTMAKDSPMVLEASVQDAPVMQIDPETGRLMQGMSGLGREGRYARSMRAIKSVRSSGRVIIPEGYTVESLRAAYSPAAYAQAAQAQQTQEVADVNAQFAAQPAQRRGKQFSDALWQDPRMVEMMTPDPRTGWARMSIGPGIGQEAYEAKVAGQKEDKTTKFLQSGAGAAWAKTPEGQKWGAGSEGQKWQAGVYDKFLQTPSGKTWAQSSAGKQWGASAAGQEWQAGLSKKIAQAAAEKNAAATIASLKQQLVDFQNLPAGTKRDNLADQIRMQAMSMPSVAVQRWYARIAPQLKMDPRMVLSVQQGGW